MKVVMIRHQLCDVHPLSSHQGSFLCCQTLRSARHQTYGGGQTREQETHEEGPGDSGAQSAPEAPTPPHSQPDRHVRNPQQLRPRPGDVSTDRNRVKYNGIKLISFCLTLRFFPSDVFLCFRADQGRLLDYIISWGNLTEEKVACYLRDVLEALQYLHNCRIVHLDVKVRSIMLFLILYFIR